MFRKYFFLLIIMILSPLSFHVYGQKSEKSIEEIYSQAVDARFDGDLPKARFLLEELMLNNFTNEYVYIQLMEVYDLYITELMQNNQKEILVNAYPGIRENIAKIWDTFPKSARIQDLGLKISWLVNDTAMGKIMAELAVESNPDSIIANFYMGMYTFTPENYVQSIPYFEKVADAEIAQGIEGYIFQSRVTLGDIAYKEKLSYLALRYYQRANEIFETPELIVKIAILQNKELKFQESTDTFAKVPVYLLTPEAFDAYMASLFSDTRTNSQNLLNLLLSKNKNVPAYSQALILSRLGSTQRALTVLSNSQFMYAELPWAAKYLEYTLKEKLGLPTEELRLQLGSYAFVEDRLDIAEQYLTNISLKFDTNGSLLWMLGSIAKEKMDFDTAEKYLLRYVKIPHADLTFNAWLSLVEINLDTFQIKTADKYFKKAQEDDNADPWLLGIYKGFFLLAEKKDTEAREYFVEALKYKPNHTGINNFIAISYMNEKNYTDALSYAETSYDLDTNSVFTQNLLAYIYAESKTNLDAAIQLAQASVDAKPNDLIYLDTLAWVYFRKHDLQKAEEIFEKIIPMLQKSPKYWGIDVIYYHLALFYQELNQLELSNDFIKKGLQINPKNTDLREMYQNE